MLCSLVLPAKLRAYAALILVSVGVEHQRDQCSEGKGNELNTGDTLAFGENALLLRSHNDARGFFCLFSNPISPHSKRH